MGAHRSSSRWLAALREHLLWPATAVAVLLLVAAVTYASRPASRPSTARADGPGGVAATGPASTPSVAPWPGAADSAAAGGDPSAGASPTGGSPGASAAAGQGGGGPSAGRTTGRPPTTQPPAPGGAFTARYQVSSSWSGGYVASVAVTNGGTVAATWRLELRLPQGVSVATTWNGTGAASGDTMTITPEQGQALQPGGTVNVGFLANQTAAGAAQGTTPLSCTINGRACG